MRRSQLYKDIFYVLAASTILVSAFFFPGVAILAKSLKPLTKYKKYHLRLALKRLRADKLIEFDEKNEDCIIKITEAGKQRILRYNFEEMKLPQSKQWNRKWYIVSSDIPENFKKARDALRFKLKTLGFHQLHKSVFIYPYECKKEIDFVGNFFGVRDYINYITADKIENEEIIKNLFDL